MYVCSLSYGLKLVRAFMLVAGMANIASAKAENLLDVQAESLLDIYQLALINSPDYLAGVRQRDGSSEIYKQARSLLLPRVGLVVTRTDTEQEIISSDNEVFGAGSTSFPTDEYTLSITQSIYNYTNWARYAQAKVELTRIDAEFMSVHQDLIFSAAEAYFFALFAHEEHTASQAENKALEQHYSLVKAKRADGLARKTDLLDAQSRYLQSQARELEALSQLKDRLQGLRELTGELPIALKLLGENMQLQPPNPQQPEEWMTTALEYNPEIKAANRAVEVARQEVRTQKGAHYPTLDLQLSLNDRATEGTLFGGGSEVQTQDITLALNIPIYAGGVTSSMVREMIQQYKKTQQELEKQLRAVRREVYSSYDGILSDIAKTEALRKSVEGYELAVEFKSLAYDSGLTTSLAVLDAERELFFSRTQYARARYDYILNTLRLKRAAGLINEDDLVQIDKLLIGGDSILLSYALVR
jgi:outer membrane protein